MTRPSPAAAVIVAGIGAALHIGKLPPAIPALQAALGLTLVEAGFLLSMVQLAGMTTGIVFGVVADGIGARRSMLVGLLLLAAASGVGGFATGGAALLALRAVEGFGFLLVVLPAPGLLRRLVAPGRVGGIMGLWGSYMPIATASALLLGPLVIGAAGWRGWWWLLAAVSLAAAALLRQSVPAQPPLPQSGWTARVRRTLRAPGPWLVATTFAVYSSQWLAVIGFLPSIYTAAGIAPAATGLLTALAAAANMLGNLGSGRLLQRGSTAPRLLTIGFTAMGLAAVAAFAAALPAPARYAAVLVFSGVGGLVPATLFALAVRLAPGDDTLGATVGWMQQWSAFGQFVGPPIVAWIAIRAGGWQWTGAATAACALAGLALTRAIRAALTGRSPEAANHS